MSRKPKEINHLPEKDEIYHANNIIDNKILIFYRHNNFFAFHIKGNQIHAVEASPDQNILSIGTVLIGKTDRVLPQMNGCFLSLNQTEKAFLPFHREIEIVPINRKPDGRVIAGDEFAVCITKLAQKSKPIEVSAKIELAGTLSVMGKGQGKVGYSSKLSELQKRELKEIIEEWTTGLTSDERAALSKIDLMIRTRAASCERTELVRSIDDQLRQYLSIDLRSQNAGLYESIYQPELSYLQMMENLPEKEIQEIVTDSEAVFELLKNHSLLCKFPIRLYESTSISMENVYSVNTRLRELLSEKVSLKSGAFLFIEHTEAMTVIDVNSGKSEKKADAEEYSRMCNLEAAAEILYQISVRNISGIIIIDFINMLKKENVDDLISFLKREVRKDKITTTYVDYTKLGLVELTRKKTSLPLVDKLKEWDWPASKQRSMDQEN